MTWVKVRVDDRSMMRWWWWWCWSRGGRREATTLKVN